ncbi:unnamed protein product [Malus baccata var. baccata]
MAEAQTLQDTLALAKHRQIRKNVVEGDLKIVNDAISRKCAVSCRVRTIVEDIKWFASCFKLIPITSRTRLHHSTILSALGPDHALTVLFLGTRTRTSRSVIYHGIALVVISLNFRVPTESKVSELPKCLVLGIYENLHISQVIDFSTSKKIWECLQQNFSQQSFANSIQLNFCLFSFTKGSQSIFEYLATAKSMAYELAAIHELISNSDLVTDVFRGLGLDY